jgi:hypothetical protein
MQIWNIVWQHRYGAVTMLVGAGLSIVLSKAMGMLCIGTGLGIVIGEFLVHRAGNKERIERVEKDVPKNRHSDEEFEKVSAYGAALNREIASLHEKLKECNQKRQMPRPYLNVLEPDEAMFRRTTFVLTNRGGDVAHNVQLQPIKIHYRQVLFDPIAVIAVQEERSTLSTVEGQGTMLEHDFMNVMREEWNAAGKLVEEYSVKLIISYEDFTGKKFEADAEVVYFPINATNHERYPQVPEWMKHEFKIIEVRRMNFREVL